MKIVAELQQLCPEHADAAFGCGAVGRGRGDRRCARGCRRHHARAAGLPRRFSDGRDVRRRRAAGSSAVRALDHGLAPEDLARHVQVVVRDSGVKQPRDEGWLGAERRCTVSSVEASLATIRAGLAYAWLPEHVVAEDLRIGSAARVAARRGRRREVFRCTWCWCGRRWRGPRRGRRSNVFSGTCRCAEQDRLRRAKKVRLHCGLRAASVREGGLALGRRALQFQPTDVAEFGVPLTSPRSGSQRMRPHPGKFTGNGAGEPARGSARARLMSRPSAPDSCRAQTSPLR